MAQFNPGEVVIEKAELISYDGGTRRDINSNIIYGWTITQAMNTVAYSGSLNILDTAGLLDGMPIRGEETLNFWVRGMDLDTSVKIAAVVHRVTDINILASSNGYTYKLHFVSKQSFKASTKKITTSFMDTPSEMARMMFEDTYAALGDGNVADPDDDTKDLPYQAVSYPIIKSGDTRDSSNEPDRNFIVLPSKNRTTLIIPDLSASEAQFFVAGRAYNPSSPSQTFRFFETLENYYFCTDEYFIKKANNNTAKILDMFFAPVVDQSGSNAVASVERIDEIHIISKGVDSSTDLNSGAYRNEVVEVDFIRRSFTISKFNYDDAQYIDMTGQPRGNLDNPHTEKYRTDNFTDNNAKRFMVMKHFDSQGDAPSELLPDQNTADIVHNRVSYYHHLNSTSLIAVTKGRLDIRPGMLINLEIKNIDGIDANVLDNKTMSGRYLVQQTVHEVSGSELTTTIKVAKFDFSGTSKEIVTTTDMPAGPGGNGGV